MNLLGGPRRPRRVRVTVSAGVLLSTALLAAPATASAAEPALVDEDDVCVVARPDRDYLEPPTDARGDSSIAATLRLAEAHGHATGEGVGVAVIDTGLAPGIAGSERMDVRASAAVPGTARKTYDAHGTWVAGIIAGHVEGELVGVAPDAHVVPIRVADGGRQVVAAQAGRTALTGVTAHDIARGIRLAMARAETDNIRIINISLSVRRDTAELADAVRDATEAGLLVVAAAGNRPQTEAGAGAAPDTAAAFQPGEDTVPFPARYDEVLAVTALAPDLSLAPGRVQTGPGIDVSAPTVGVKTLGVEGRTCLLPTIATSWATAVVSGTAALLFSQQPQTTADRVRARIEATARGVGSAGALDGHGMVQPLAALTADLEITADGRVVRGDFDREEPAPLSLPVEDEAAPELLGRLRRWGVFGGAVLVLALAARPLTQPLTRRR